MCALSVVMGDAIDYFSLHPLWLKDKSNRRTLERAMEAVKVFDTKTDQPDCENDEKKRLIQDMAEKLGVKVGFPF